MRLANKPFCNTGVLIITNYKRMSDDKTNKGTRDDVTIDINDPSEVEYAARQVGMTSPEFRELMKREGTSNRAKLMEAAKRR